MTDKEKRFVEYLVHVHWLEVGFGRDTSPTQPTELRYQMALEKLDELVKLIFETSGINAAYFVDSVVPDALRYLSEQNRIPLA